VPTRRPAILMAALLVLIAGYIFRPDWLSTPSTYPAPVAPQEAPLAGTDSLSNLVVKQNSAGLWQADFDYFYTGEPRIVQLLIRLPGNPDEPSNENTQAWQPTLVPVVKRGAHHATAVIAHPSNSFQGITRQVVVDMVDRARGATLVATTRTDQVIDWPDWMTWTMQREISQRSPQENLDRAIALIDSGNEYQIQAAKPILERLIANDPALVQGYIELARIAMKTSWGAEGLHQAEGLLASALQIEAGNANAKILLGYVRAHQRRYRQAEQLFAEAAASNPRNLWLWANWGEVLVMQSRFDEAATKYREAIERPMAHGAYDNARLAAYEQLISLQKRKNDLDGVELLYKKRVADFGYGSCYNADYARFLLQQRGDANAAIDVARKALDQDCDGWTSRQILGLAYYVVWGGSEGQARSEALNQARVYLPTGPVPMYLLASSDKTVGVAAKLVAAGEKIDQKDNKRLNALAHAIQREDLPAVRRLLRLGAKADTPVGYDDMPVALVPVLRHDVDMVKLMQQSGVDYSAITYQGATAFDFAKQAGDPALVDALQPRPQVL
jgi:predicted Zn-dependent protease